MNKKKSKSLIRLPISEKAKVTKQAILQAAIHIALKEGLEKVNTNHIAERAGVSIGSLYQYYKSKEDIFDELLDYIIEKRQKRIKSVLDFNVLTGSIEAVVAKVVSAMFDSDSAEEAQLEGLLTFLILKKTHDKKVLMRAELMDAILYPAIKSIIIIKNPKIMKRDLDTVIFVLIQSMRGLLLASGLSSGQLINKEHLKLEVVHMIVSYLEARG